MGDLVDENLLVELIAEARAAWPAIALDQTRFARHLAARIPDGEDARTVVRTLRIADLYLACACADGDAVALALFERDFLARVPAFVRRIDASAPFADEVRQLLRTKLLVGADGAPPKICDYSGLGPLQNWLRVAALRAALDLRRGGPEQVHASQDLAGKPALATGLDPETDLIRARYQGEFQTALEEALTVLPARDRNLLRMHFVDGLSIDKLAPAFRVHRATCARWIQSARERLLDETRRRLVERLRLSAAEFDSLAGAVASGLHLSLPRLFLSNPAL
jgi:RNA polymerase sigma-70 factor (ECF subfamily)